MSKRNDDWKYWETLAYEFVKNLYKDVFVKNELHTKNSHDSGFDGIWLLRPVDSNLLKLILMEAKYRTSQSSLPLNDCAKAIIIAFNLGAKQLYIVTNIPFAPQTKINISKFKKRSQLEITCVNRNDLKYFIQNNINYLVNICEIDKEFLLEIEQSLSNLQNIELENFENDNTLHEYIYINGREKQIKQIVNSLLHNSICLLCGNAGSGKSVSSAKVRDKLEKFQYDVCTIDLNLCTSARVLYLCILECVWGVNLDSILEDSDLVNYIDTLISVGDGVMESGVRDAVKYILLTSMNKYQKRKDIFLHYLLKYLELIIKPNLEELKLVIFFENINMASEEVLTFLLDIINTLRKNNIGVLLEVRTPFLLQEMEDIQKAEIYFKRLQQCSNIQFTIEPFGRENSIRLIKNHFNFNDNVCNSLAYTLYDNPLEIHSGIRILENQLCISDAYINSLSLEDLELYWEKLGITFNTTIISLINNLQHQKDFAQIFELTVLFRAHIPYEVISLFWGNKLDEVLQKAEKSTIFKKGNSKLECLHLRYLDAMKKISNPNIRYLTAKKVLEYIHSLEYKDNFNSMVELDILYIIDDIDNIPQSTLLLAKNLIVMHQYKDALKELLRCIQKCKEDGLFFSSNINDTLIEIVMSALLCIRELHEENNSDYEYIYTLAENGIILADPEINNNKLWYIYQLLIWHKSFVVGKLENSLCISKELYDSLKGSIVLFCESDDYPGQVYNAYGLSVKMIYGGEQAEKIFEEGIRLYPNSHYAKAALLSQQGNQLLKCNPTSAIEKYKELLNEVEGKSYPYQEILHSKTDISMAFFLSGKYTMSMTWANESIKEATSINMLSEKGRAKNIYGCCQAAKKQYSECIDSFRESVLLLGTVKSTLYLWRAQLNLASALLYDKDGKDEAISLLNKVLDELENTFESKIQKDNTSVPYQGLLLVLMYFYELKEDKLIDRIKKKFENTMIIEDFSNLIVFQKDWRNQFNSKVINCSGIVLVTG